MKFIEKYRDRESVQRCAAAIRATTTKDWKIMEVCGGQTNAIVRFGLDTLLPPGITLIHGPGCPVCVTPLELLDKAIAIAARPEVIFCSFGDMLRVPGSDGDLFGVKAKGGDVRMVYSPLDALKIAQDNPTKEVVFFAVGFETTAPGNALAISLAQKRNMKNFSVLVSHVLVPPAMEAILSGETNQVQAFLAAGHVCSVMGYHQYLPLTQRYKTPIVVTGFEPLDILQGILLCVRQLEAGKAEVENQYIRVVTEPGNKAAQELLKEVFQIASQKWRGIGSIAHSGFALRQAYADFDALNRFDLDISTVEESDICISGLVLQGERKPGDCPEFAKACGPDSPLGATMVSEEGACSAYYRYRRHSMERGE
jgi:hydrogenase expression/formation protein HypD